MMTQPASNLAAKKATKAKLKAEANVTVKAVGGAKKVKPKEKNDVAEKAVAATTEEPEVRFHTSSPYDIVKSGHRICLLPPEHRTDPATLKPSRKRKVCRKAFPSIEEQIRMRDVEQNSVPWHGYRDGSYGGSGYACFQGYEDSYATNVSAWKVETGREEVVPKATTEECLPMDRGHYFEDETAAMYCKIMNAKDYSMGILLHWYYPHIHISPDRLVHLLGDAIHNRYARNDKRRLGLEIKNPIYKAYQTKGHGRNTIPAHYVPQLMMQMATFLWDAVDFAVSWKANEWAPPVSMEGYGYPEGVYMVGEMRITRTYRNQAAVRSILQYLALHMMHLSKEDTLIPLSARADGTHPVCVWDQEEKLSTLTVPLPEVPQTIPIAITSDNAKQKKRKAVPEDTAPVPAPGPTAKKVKKAAVDNSTVVADPKKKMVPATTETKVLKRKAEQGEVALSVPVKKVKKATGIGATASDMMLLSPTPRWRKTKGVENVRAPNVREEMELYVEVNVPISVEGATEAEKYGAPKLQFEPEQFEYDDKTKRLILFPASKSEADWDLQLTCMTAKHRLWMNSPLAKKHGFRLRVQYPPKLIRYGPFPDVVILPLVVVKRLVRLERNPDDGMFPEAIDYVTGEMRGEESVQVTWLHEQKPLRCSMSSLQQDSDDCEPLDTVPDLESDPMVAEVRNPLWIKQLEDNPNSCLSDLIWTFATGETT